MPGRERAGAIVLNKKNQILLVERIKNGAHYFVIPGGGVKPGETYVDAAVREVREETRIDVKAVREIYTLRPRDGPSDIRNNHHYIICEYISGEPRLDDASVERARMAEGKGNNEYFPQWMDTGRLPGTLVYPLEIRDWLIEDIPTGFRQTPREATIRL